MTSASSHIFTVGDNVVDRYPDLDVMFPGGNAVNVAVHARRCGARATYLGALGTDAAGELLRRSLVNEGVDTGMVRTVDGANAHAVVRVVDGNRIFGPGDIGVSRFSPSQPDLAALGEADLVHTGECSMLEADLPRIAQAARLLSFDFSERPWDYVQEYARHADVAILSATDGSAPAELATRVAALGPRTVAVTQGYLGATLLVDGELLQAPAGPGEVVDTLGAGDAFIARLLVGLVTGAPLAGVLVAATHYATATCNSYGAFGYETALPALLPARVSAANT